VPAVPVLRVRQVLLDSQANRERMARTDRQDSMELLELPLAAQPVQPVARSALLASLEAQDHWVHLDRLEHQAMLALPDHLERAEMLDHQDLLAMLDLQAAPDNPALLDSPDNQVLAEKDFPVQRDHPALQVSREPPDSLADRPNQEHKVRQDLRATQEKLASRVVMDKPVSQADRECQEVTPPTAHAPVVPDLLLSLLLLLLPSLAVSAPRRSLILPLELAVLVPAATNAKSGEPKMEKMIYHVEVIISRGDE